MKVARDMFQTFSAVLGGFSGILCDHRACQKRFGSSRKGCGDVIEGFLPKNQLKSRENNSKTKILDNFGT